MVDMRITFHSGHLAETASASEERTVPVRNFTSSFSTSFWALHGGGWIAAGVLVDELKRPAEHAAPGVDLLAEQLTRSLGLRPVLSVAARQRRGEANLDRLRRRRAPEEDRRAQSRPDSAGGRHCQELTSRRAHRRPSPVDRVDGSSSAYIRSFALS